MKRIFFYTLLTTALFNLMGCSQKDDDASVDGKLDLKKTLRIKLNFTDYNEDIKVEGTRAIPHDTLSHEWIDLGNGMSAEVTVKPDTTKSKATAKTRIISDGTYTLVAYDASSHTLEGEITGNVVSGIFTPSAGFDVTPNKNYDFVCYNSKVTRNGNMLSVTKANAEYARIGRTTQFIPNSLSRQWISFNMKPAASRVKIQLDSWVDIPALTADLSTVTGQTVPSVAQYDMSTGTWSTGTGVANSGNLTFPAATVNNYGYLYDGVSDAYSSSQYLYYLPATDIGKLKLTLHGTGKLFNIPVEGANILLNGLKDGAGLATTMKPTYSYTVSVKLVYNYLYLMSDGTTGLFRQTTFGGGQGVPVGIVVSKSKHLAMAVKGIYGDYPSVLTYWIDSSKPYSFSLPSYGQGYNTRMYSYTESVAALQDMKGYDWTWDAASSWNGMTVKADEPFFAAFHKATHESPAPVNGKKWFLPSAGHLVEMLYNLGFADRAATPLSAIWSSGPSGNAWCDLYPLTHAINDVGGSIWGGHRFFQTSTECESAPVYMWVWGLGDISFRPEAYNGGALPTIIPFIIYQ